MRIFIKGRKNMKKLVSVLLVSFAAISCVHLNGEFDVKQSFKVKSKAGFLHLGSKEIQLETGIYDADLKIVSDKNYKLSIKPKGTDEKKIVIPIKSDSDFNVPTQGEFKIAGSKIGQPFD
jgi:hypothetical protein